MEKKKRERRTMVDTETSFRNRNSLTCRWRQAVTREGDVTENKNYVMIRFCDKKIWPFVSMHLNGLLLVI